ncbi:MAG: zinc ABC transporter substrate-binding protein [Tepidimonas sp.]|uniref:metal ABC transporter solute-binding protein, Zn/Mn family n=1 Tax=Tepidimonas sp. TaxID=2002775 RepID=UPI00298EFBE9|nr:zinc ABC transporter substrate-binding protein [Tepidimonas sp.]MDW8336678.1 zinc ABC transporter substrate-binding protein [Tepidimonas sp.]
MSKIGGDQGLSRRALLRWSAVAASAVSGWTAGRTDAPLPVVASFSILGDWVRRVGGERVRVETLVGPESDAHVFQPSPADVRRVAAARLVLLNGWGLEGWMERLLRNAAYRGTVVRVTEGMEPLRAARHDPHAHGPHSHGDVDPHVWQDVTRARHAVLRIAQALCAVDAAGCEGYRARAEAYAQQLEALDQEIRAAWATIAPQQRKVVTSHDALGYYARAYGVQIWPVQGLSTDSQPSAAAVARLVRLVRREQVRAIFVERLADTRLVEQIAREAGVRPSTVPLYVDTLSGPEGPAPDYVALMRHNTRAMVEAIRAAVR